MLISGEMEITGASLPLETFSSNTSCGNGFNVTWNVRQETPENSF